MRFLAFTLIAGLLTGTGSTEAQSAESRIVTAVGRAPVYDNNRVKAVEDAEQAALVKAIETAVGVMITSETEVVNHVLLRDRIYSKTSGYVRNHRQVGAPVFISDYAEVRVEAEIAQGDLTEDMAGIATLIEGLKRPKILISVDEQMHIMDVRDSTVSTTPGNTMAGVITKHLADHQFNIISATSEGELITQEEAQAAAAGDTATIRSLVDRFGTAVLIVGKAAAQRSDFPKGLYETIDKYYHIYGATAIARAIRLDTGALVAQAEPEEKNTYHINAVTAATTVIKDTSEDIAEDLMRKILVRWQDEYTSGSAITVVLKNTVFADINAFKYLLENRVLGVRSVSEPDFGNGEARYEVLFLGNGNKLAQEITRPNELFDVTPSAVRGNLVELEAVKK